MLIIYLEWLFIIHYLFKDSSIIYLNYLQDCGDVDLILENPEKYKQYEFLIKQVNIIEDMLSKEITFSFYINLIKNADNLKQQ